MPEVTGEFVAALAAANGIEVPKERVELVRREYENLMRSVAIISGLSVPAGTEPAIGQSLAPPSLADPDGRR
jgi:hypothetical protein